MEFLKKFNFHKIRLTFDGKLFLLICVLQLVYLLCLIAFRRMVMHDTFAMFSLQYYFLNNVAWYGEFPQWIPYVMHGLPTACFLGIHSVNNLLSQVLFHTGALIRNISFLNIFYCGIFLDLIFFITGMWLLAKRFFRDSAVVFFVCLTAVTTSVWVNQIMLNFYFCFSLPMILYLALRFLDDLNYRYLFLSLNLLIFQIVLSSAYMIGVLSLTVCVFVAFYSGIYWKQIKANWKKPYFGLEFLVWVLGTIGLGLVVFFLLKAGKESDIVFNSVGRNGDGSVSLKGFLSYGPQISFKWWLEMLAGFHFRRDFSRYIGIGCLPLMVVGFLFNHQKKNMPFYGIIIFLLLLNCATPLADLVFYAWPFMKYFRHLGAISTIIRIFLCFVAGFGLEFIYQTWRQKNVKRYGGVLAVIVLCTSLAIIMAVTPKILLPIFESINHPALQSEYGSTYLVILEDSLKENGKILFVMCLIGVGLLFTRQNKSKNFFIFAFFFIHLFDISSFVFRDTVAHTYGMNQQQYATTRFVNLPWRDRRTVHENPSNPRINVLADFSFRFDNAAYWTAFAYLFEDSVQTAKFKVFETVGREVPFLYYDFVTMHWTKSLDRLMRVLGGQDPNDTSQMLDGFNKDTRAVVFPLHGPFAKKIVAVAENKIQVFDRAFLIENDQSMAKAIRDKSLSGDVLLVSGQGVEGAQSPGLLTEFTQEDLRGDNRLPVTYSIKRFEANHVVIELDTKQARTSWLFYSDAWHPHWRATVNGKQVPVYSAYFAYKAVPLEQGKNRVHFYFHWPQIVWAVRFLGLVSLFWIGFVLKNVFKICLVRERN